jgi:hypothetical protein
MLRLTWLGGVPCWLLALAAAGNPMLWPSMRAAPLLPAWGAM